MKYCVQQKRVQANKLQAENVQNEETEYCIEVNVTLFQYAEVTGQKLISSTESSTISFTGPKPTCSRTNSIQNSYADKSNCICTACHVLHRM
jgi:hypothetical protein